MKKINFLLISILLVLTISCNKSNNNNLTDNNKENMPKENNTQTGTNSSTGEEIKGSVTLDLNPPLAGKNLTFDIKLEKVQSGTVANSGSQVEVNYTGTLDNGEVFDSSYKRNQTLPFKVGAGQMIPGFDKAVEGMKVGDTKKVTLEPKDAYGEYDKKKIQVVPKKELKSFIDAGFKLEKGEELPTQLGNIKIIKSTNE